MSVRSARKQIITNINTPDAINLLLPYSEKYKEPSPAIILNLAHSVRQLCTGPQLPVIEAKTVATLPHGPVAQAAATQLSTSTLRLAAHRLQMPPS